MKQLSALGWVIASGLAFGYQVAPQPNGTPAPATASIAGQVINATTGAPLKKATITLNGLNARPTGGMPIRFSAQTDETGRFSFEALEAGRYMLAAERTGFLRQSYGARKYSTGGTPVTLTTDQHMKDVLFKLSQQSVITGKVLDEDGDPVANIQIRVMKFQYQLGKKTWVQTGGAQTADNGEYRAANLDPGKYVVGILPLNRGNYGVTPSNGPMPKSPETSYAPTYYPSAADTTTAVPVEVGAASEVRGIDIHARMGPVFRIRGRVLNATGRVPVQISPKEGGGMILSNDMTMPPDYRFEFHGIAPGTYVLHTQTGNGNQLSVAIQEVQVTNQHLDNVVLSISSGNDLQGSVRVEDATAPVAAPNLSVYLRPDIQIGYGASGKAGDDLNFTIRNVVPMHYLVSVSGTPDTCYVKSIRYGGQAVPEQGVDILSAGVLEVVLSATAGEIDAMVGDKDGKPVANAVVALFTKDGPASGTRANTTDDKGSVVFKGLKPGEYRLIAWEDVPRGAYQDPEFVKQYENSGETVKLDASARQAVQLKVIPAE